MAHAKPRPASVYAWTGAALVILLLLNITLAQMIQGRIWNLAALLVIPAAQALLVVIFLMSLPKAGRASWVYVGIALVLLLIACLTLTDYLTRSSPLELEGRDESGGVRGIFGGGVPEQAGYPP